MDAAMGELEHPATDELELVEVLQALSDPVRLQIVARLAADAELACGDFGLPVGKSTASHHFRVLREAGVVSVRDEGTRRYHSLRRDDLDVRFPGLLDGVLQSVSALTR